MNRLDALKARLAAATPGPWKSGGDEVYSGFASTYAVIGSIYESTGRQDENANFIAHSPADLAHAVEVIEAATLPRNALIDGAVGRFIGRWIAIPEQDFDALRAALAYFQEDSDA